MKSLAGQRSSVCWRVCLAAILFATLVATPPLARSQDPPTPTPAPTPTPTPAPSPAPAPPQSPSPEEPVPQSEPIPGAAETKPAGSETQPAPSQPEAEKTLAPAIAPKPEEPPTPSGQLETILVLKDGSQVVGRLVSIEDNVYTMLIAGIPTKFSKENVLRLMPQPPLEERYKQMRAAIDDTDLDRRVLLAEWLRERKRYDLALAELDSVLKIEPAHPRAREIKKTIELQIDIDQAAQKRKAAREGTKPGEKTPAPDAESEDARESEQSRPFPVLSEDQINLLRVYEIDLANPPRLLIPRELIAALIQRYGDDSLLPATAAEREKLYQAKPSQILDLMYRLKAKDLYAMVRVMEDPHSLQTFKRDVHQGWIMNGCATGRCHGGEEAGRLMLKRSRATDTSTLYTNFLILDRFRLADGRPLINYDEPEKSPLLQMAMPRNLTTRPHPVVRNQAGADQWKPAIRSTDDRRYHATLDWIRSMYRPRPEYGINYEPPLPKGILPLAPAPNGER